MSNHFHPMVGLTKAEQRDKNCREFIGDGTPYLFVPGLKSLKKVRIGMTELPIEIIEQVPVNADATLHEAMELTMVKLEMGPGGVPVLLRNVKSNDGIWQANTPIFVTGEWEAEGKTPAA